MKILLSILNIICAKVSEKKTFKVLLLSVISFSSIVSFKNITFNLYFNSVYKEYAEFIKSLDFNVFSEPGITFPIWGYGFIHLLGENKLIVLLIQQALTFYSLLYLDRILIRYNLIKRMDLFRISILLSLPWFLFHTQMWPKSIASNLLLIGVLLIIEYLKTNNSSKLLFSSFLFGLLHNFRPDYLYLSFALYFLIIIFTNKRNYKTFCLPLIQYVMLIPWMIFTFHQTGKAIPTSSNAGHVFFIGLGQLPNNIWGITPVDEDPEKIKILTAEFGPDFKSDNHREDIFLKQKFKEYVIKNPGEWVKKCFYAFRLLALDPFYVGNVGNFQQNKISNIKEIRKLESNFYEMKFKENLSLIKQTKWDFSYAEVFQLIITVYTKIYGIMLFAAFLIFLLIVAVKSKFKNILNSVDVILLIIIGYQMSISIFAFHMPVYNTSIYIFYLLMTNLLFQKYLSIKQ